MAKSCLVIVTSMSSDSAPQIVGGTGTLRFMLIRWNPRLPYMSKEPPDEPARSIKPSKMKAPALLGPMIGNSTKNIIEIIEKLTLFMEQFLHNNRTQAR
jgi:hypothetical protein